MSLIVPESFTETDPVFSAAPASSIAAGDITNWDTAYGWSDHAAAGYLGASDIGSTVLAYDTNLQAFTTALTLPTVDGTAGQTLKTDGAGTVSFADVVTNGQVINGTAFFVTNTKPTTRIGGGALVAGDKWYKPDEGTEWFWNGTYWLSLPEYSINWIGRSFTSTAYTPNFVNTFTPNWDLSTQLFFTKLKVVYTLSTADSSNYWQVGIFRVWNVFDAGTLVFLTSPATNGVITNTLTQATNGAFIYPGSGFGVRIVKTGSPGTLEINQTWTYRKIAQ